MKIDGRAFVLDVLSGVLIAALALHCNAYPEATRDPEVCEAEGVKIQATPGEGACVFAQLKVRRFFAVFRGKPGFDVEQLRGFVVVVAPESDGGAFPNKACSCDAGGEAVCGARQIRLASVHLHNLGHELAHAAESCARDESAETLYAQSHPRWDQRGVPQDLFAVENG